MQSVQTELLLGMEVRGLWDLQFLETEGPFWFLSVPKVKKKKF